MTPSGLYDVPKKADRYPRHKRSESLVRMVKNISYVALGIMLYAAWHHFRTFEQLLGALGPIPHAHPMHRGIETAVFLAVATLPLVVYLILGLRLRRKPRRGTR